MRVPLTWVREYVAVEAPAREIAERLAVSSAEVERVIRMGVSDENGNFDRFVVGRVVDAAKHPDADRLQLCRVDVGEPEPRQILAGIAEHYEPEKLVGRKLVIVANLKPRKLRGFESQGMVLAASVGDEGRPVLATFTEDVPNGARLK